MGLKTRAILLVLLAGSIWSHVQAATLNIDGGGFLLGASNVDIGGSLYDVVFEDGSCVSLFDGCDDPADFTFITEADANAASLALLEQVFIDGGLGLFDSNPMNTKGCESNFLCVAYTPFDLSGTSVLAFVAVNFNSSGTDSASGVAWFDAASINQTTLNSTFAIWSPVSAVPVPAAIWLFGTALIGLVGFGKRKPN